MTFSPSIKGLITGAALIAFSLLAWYAIPAGSPLHYLIYLFYVAGILWALLAHKRGSSTSGSFGDFFQAGFRCFIVAILMMAIFTYIFNKIHPEFAAESAAAYRNDLVQNSKDLTPAEIDRDVARYQNGYPLAKVYGQIIGYLIIGVAVSAAAAGIMSNRNK